MRKIQSTDSSTFTPAYTTTNPWRLNLGAEVQTEGVLFRVWAPKCQRVEMVIENGHNQVFPLVPETDGYFSGFVAHLTAGALYWYCLDDNLLQYPDPCSRFQPYGPHGS